MHNRIKYNSCGVGILPAQYMQFKCGTAYLLDKFYTLILVLTN
ncbi:hypothetical protein GXM_09171 [Nostoc sphaeroides CCNUC1]|uniref:Uncharacterized protein n=1 Tax=Nostoc sphaeroides CCNUC1 TaxID=2653204 RepID=A0A5P8WFR8_9NOSO|nr:hypothetical protein GXM_09171 [Nostoc sphaeroides CCNUC1]